MVSSNVVSNRGLRIKKEEYLGGIDYARLFNHFNKNRERHG